jgi:hypothetical protein
MVDVEAPEHPTDDTEVVGPKGATPGRILALIAVIAMIMLWVAIFAGYFNKDNPDKLQDEAYVAQLEDQCQALRDDLDTLPNAADIDSAGERADVLDDANVMVASFVDELAANAPTSGDAKVSVEGWIADWRIYLENREDFADRLRTDPDAQLLLDRSELGDSVDKTIQIFSQVNEIPACETPGDVG